jgi:hypothetical protein
MFKFISLALIVIVFVSGCETRQPDKPTGSLNDVDVASSPEKDAQIQKYNLEQEKKLTYERTPCDDISIKEFVLNYYPDGTYLVNIDNVLSDNQNQPALIKFIHNNRYIFGVIAKSRPGERLIETKNIVGFDQSFIDLDSTDLGTAFFYLVLFECVDNSINFVWETVIPSHGGFHNFSLRNWKYRNTPYIKVDFHYARGSGHIDYNYFLVNGIQHKPHLMMTYEGINFKRTISNINNDEFPDYYEHIYFDSGSKVTEKDSVGFTWDQNDSVYVNIRNKKQTRLY